MRTPFEGPDALGYVRVHVKVVPGGSRDAVAGLLGDRVRLKVAAPPEGGRANRAAMELVAGRLGVPVSRVRLVRGETTPRKTLAVRGVALDALRAALGAEEAE